MILNSNTDGVCPFCNHKIKYGCMEAETDGYIYYPWTCEHCGRKGDAFFQMKFIGHNYYDKNDDSVIITNYMLGKEEV